MNPAIRRISCAGLGLMAIVLAVQAPAQRPPGGPGDDSGIEQLRPQWRVGDQWVVETATLQIQNAAVGVKPQRGQPIQWQFTVVGQQQLQGRDCYQIEARPIGQSQTPITQIWVDRRSLALCQLQTQAAVGGQWKTVTESYQFPNGQPAPVQGPLTALPIDLPLFLGGGMKGSQEFTYEVTAGPEGRKALGDVGFAMSIQQDTDTAPPQEVKSLLGDEFTKDLTTKPVVEVRLKSALGQVRQLWQAGSPWPVYADNGTTIARLVKTTAPQPNARPEVRQ